MKVYWLNDTIFHTKLKNRRLVKKLVENILKKFSNRNNHNIIIDPIETFGNLFASIDMKNFDTILCLSNKYTPLLEDLFPDKKIITYFIARIRDVTKDSWPTVNFWKGSSIEKLNGKILIFDDVSISGETLSEVLNDLQLKSNQFEIALLISIKDLRKKRWKIHSAFEITDKNFDLWHLEDWMKKIPNNLFNFFKTNKNIKDFLQKNGIKKSQVNPFLWMNKFWVESFWQMDKLEDIKKDLNNISKFIIKFDALNSKYAPSSFYSNKDIIKYN